MNDVRALLLLGSIGRYERDRQSRFDAEDLRREMAELSDRLRVLEYKAAAAAEVKPA